MSELEFIDECPDCQSQFIARIIGTSHSGICEECGWRGSLVTRAEVEEL